MSRISTMLAAILLLAVPARATMVEVPLPGLHGFYNEPNGSRTVTFQMADPPGAVYGVSLRVSGTQNIGSIVCEWGGPFPWPMQVFAEMEDAPNGWWYTGASPDLDESFTRSGSFSPTSSSVTWTFLMDGTGTITFYYTPAGLVGLCFIDPVPPTGEITAATLLVDGDFPIRIEPTTWGRIKALYRD